MLTLKPSIFCLYTVTLANGKVVFCTHENIDDEICSVPPTPPSLQFSSPGLCVRVLSGDISFVVLFKLLYWSYFSRPSVPHAYTSILIHVLFVKGRFRLKLIIWLFLFHIWLLALLMGIVQDSRDCCLHLASWILFNLVICLKWWDPVGTQNTLTFVLQFYRILM